MTFRVDSFSFRVTLGLASGNGKRRHAILNAANVEMLKIKREKSIFLEA